MVPDSLGNMNGILTEPGLRERIKVPEGRVLENEKTLESESDSSGGWREGRSENPLSC